MICLVLVNTTAFCAITSISVIGFQISYAIPIFLRITAAKDTFVHGNFNLGKYGLVFGWISLLWLVFTSALFLFPVEFPITAENFNYTGVIVFAVLTICGVYWVVDCRYWFTGPKRDMNIEMFK